MTGRYTLSPRAQLDLEEIWDHTAKCWGIDQAETYTRQLWLQINTLATHPTIGLACPEIRPGYYKFPSGSHFLFYRRINDGIDVVRILHERMDFTQHI